MADEKSQNIDAAMDAAWNEVMGKDSEVVEDETHHLGVLTDDSSDDDKNDNNKADENDTDDNSSDDNQDEGKTEEKEASNDESDDAGDDEANDSDEKDSDDNASGEDAIDPPEHWPSEDKEMFAKVPAEGQKWLLGRHKQMEADYTRKTQESAEAIKVGNTFSELIPQNIKSQMKAQGVTGEQFVGQLMSSYSQSLTNPADFVRQVVKTANLDPAEVFKLQKQPDDDTNVDPRFEQLERRMDQQEQSGANAVRANAQTTVQEFQNQKNDKGELVYPHFDKVRTKMGHLMIANDQLSLEDAYETCVLADPELRPQPPANTEEVQQSKKDADERINRAKAATRVNKKGRGSAIVRDKNSDKPMSLQDSMNAAADEIGL